MRVTFLLDESRVFEDSSARFNSFLMQRWQSKAKMKFQNLIGWIFEFDVDFPRTYYYFIICNEPNSSSRAFDDLCRMIVVDCFVLGVT